MNFLQKWRMDATSGVAIVDGPEALTALNEPDCAAAIWRRRIPTRVQDSLDQLDPECLPKGRIILRPDEVGDAVEHLCDMAGLPDGPERTWLETDISALSQVFARLMSARHLRVRLDVVTTNSCRKFHVDAVHARLVCTYRGTGTQYGISTDGDDPRRVFTVPTGAPILLRGALWPESPPSGLRHRSPPIEGTGESRLVLVLDPINDPEDAV
ncbi:MAG: DUF1826 domain-containing protein [Pseudomonadota bacterium]